MENNPYAPSASSLQGAPDVVADGGTTTGFRDLSGISSKLSWLLLMGVGLEVLRLASSFMQLNLLLHPPFSVAQANANDLREKLISWALILLFLITVIVFARWIYLAQKNLPELGARLLRFGPGWALGVFFVPVLNLWAPYQAMGQLAKASRDPRTWELEDTPVLILIWWILWLLKQFIGDGMLGLKGSAHTIDKLQVVTVMQGVSAFLSIPLYLLANYIVRRVWRDQSETYAQIR